MSPTMNEGGIVEWKFKVGQPFKAGDSLLEVETDKAQIDVEAQDDGVIAKILLDNGTKDIKVGTPIAILASPSDDLATLELPEVKTSAPAAKPAPKAATPGPTPSPSPKAAAQPAATSSSHSQLHQANAKQTLFPSVVSLLESNGISKEEAFAKIQASGPNGRILKGDVLAYLGKIPTESVEKVSELVNSHMNLDLKNIEKLKIKSKSDSSTKKSGSTAAPPPKPKTLTKEFNLTKFKNSTSTELAKLSVDQFVSKASQKARIFAYNPKPIKSDYYDPLFEELVSVPNNVDRFKINLNINKSSSSSSGADEFDDLLGLLNNTPAPSSKDANATVKVTVELVPGISDAETKAKNYLAKLEEYLN